VATDAFKWTGGDAAIPEALFADLDGPCRLERTQLFAAIGTHRSPRPDAQTLVARFGDGLLT
jgi:hypothetical protein